jgi:hypothetical protein
MQFITYKVDDRQYSAKEVLNIVNSTNNLSKILVHSKVSEHYFLASAAEVLAPLFIVGSTCVGIHYLGLFLGFDIVVVDCAIAGGLAGIGAGFLSVPITRVLFPFKPINEWDTLLKDLDEEDSYSGAELVYLLNTSRTNKKDEALLKKAIDKFITHDIEVQEVPYIDDAGWFSGPSAVLNCHKNYTQEENIVESNINYGIPTEFLHLEYI